MPITFSCPVCGKRLQVADRYAGKQSKCKCGEVIRVPAVPILEAAGGPPSRSPVTIVSRARELPGGITPGPKHVVGAIAVILFLIACWSVGSRKEPSVTRPAPAPIPAQAVADTPPREEFAATEGDFDGLPSSRSQGAKPQEEQAAATSPEPAKLDVREKQESAEERSQKKQAQIEAEILEKRNRSAVAVLNLVKGRIKDGKDKETIVFRLRGHLSDFAGTPAAEETKRLLAEYGEPDESIAKLEEEGQKLADETLPHKIAEAEAKDRAPQGDRTTSAEELRNSGGPAVAPGVGVGGAKAVQVKGYTTKGGTYVAPYSRSAPRK